MASITNLVGELFDFLVTRSSNLSVHGLSISLPIFPSYRAEKKITNHGLNRSWVADATRVSHDLLFAWLISLDTFSV
jgi:hypothetical protein